MGESAPDGQGVDGQGRSAGVILHAWPTMVVIFSLAVPIVSLAKAHHVTAAVRIRTQIIELLFHPSLVQASRLISRPIPSFIERMVVTRAGGKGCNETSPSPRRTLDATDGCDAHEE
jgi:hypothetical protein